LIVVAGALIATTGTALAQASSGAETIIVTGFRTSLEKSLQAKRNSTTAIDTITAEDIAKFPDLNLGEAVQRVPGVALSRAGGEGRNISVRGLGPIFTRVLVNGMEAQATTGSTDNDGGNNRNRQFDFNVFAPDLFNSLTVAKTQDAAAEEGSLGATVNMVVAHPLDSPGFHFALGVKEGYDELSKEKSPRASFLISNTFLDDKLGFVLSGAYTRRQLLEEGISAVRYNNNINVANQFFQSVGGTNCVTAIVAACAAADSAYHPRFAGRLDHYLDDQTRRSGSLSVQFEPWETTKFTVDGLYADYAATREEMFLEAPSFSTTGNCSPAANTGLTIGSPQNGNTSCGIRATDLLAGFTIIDTGVPFFGTPPLGYVGTTVKQLAKGTFNDVDLRVEHRFDKLDTKFRQLTFNLQQELAPDFRVNFLAGYNASKHLNPIQTTLIWDLFDTDGFSYDLTQGNIPAVNYGTAQTSGALTNATNWTLTQIRLRPQTTFNSFKTYSANFEWDTWDNFTIRFGYDAKRYSFKTTEARRVFLAAANGSVYPKFSAGAAAGPPASITSCGAGLNANQETCIPLAVAWSVNTSNTLPSGALPTTSYAQLVNFSLEGLGAPAGQISSWVVPNYDAAVQLMDLYNPAKFPVSPTTQIGNNRGVRENDSGGYLQGDFDGHFMGMMTRGSVGVRSVRTKQTTTGATANAAGVISSITSSRTYWDTLPSANLVFEPTDDLLLRLAAAKVVARPDLGQLAGTSVSVSGNNRTVTVANPGLSPFQGTAYDAAVEWYFAKEALISLAYFYKKLSNTIVTQTTTGNYNVTFGNFPGSGLTLQAATDACGGTPGCTNASSFTFNQPVNAPGGHVNGVEVTFQTPFSFLPAPISNFGLLANVTYINSAVKYPNGATFIENQLNNLSRRTYNWTLYYDDGTFEARISTAHRTRYLTRVPGQDAGINVETTAPTTNVDASAVYALSKHFSITAEAVNLTDEFQEQDTDSANFVTFYHHSGREFFLGARLKY
jgi:TonB-dependent receptor